MEGWVLLFEFIVTVILFLVHIVFEGFFFIFLQFYDDKLNMDYLPHVTQTQIHFFRGTIVREKLEFTLLWMICVFVSLHVYSIHACMYVFDVM